MKYRELYTRGRLNYIVAICVLKLQCHTASEEIILAKISWYVYLVLFNYLIYNSGNPGPVHISFLSFIMDCKIITAWYIALFRKSRAEAVFRNNLYPFGNKAKA